MDSTRIFAAALLGPALRVGRAVRVRLDVLSALLERALGPRSRGPERPAPLSMAEIRTSDDILAWLERGVRELAPDEETSLRRVARLAYWLDDRFRIPGTNRRVGLDGLVGLLPGIGDVGTSLIAAYILLEAARLGVPKAVLARMLANIGVDFAVGLVPLVGDLADLAWKANRRNAHLLRDHLLAARAGAAAHRPLSQRRLAEP